jgi:ribosomal protein S18 acetylase RimI-like enzyme
MPGATRAGYPTWTGHWRNDQDDHVEDVHLGILWIAVIAPWRGRGIGNQLMTRAIEACKGKFEIIQLAVFGVNERAQRLYERHGFEVYERAPRAIKRGNRYIDRVLMRRPV